MKEDIRNLDTVGIYKYNTSKETDDAEYYSGIPTDLIRCDIFKKYGVERIFYLIYFELDRNKTIDRRSTIQLGTILEYCGYKLNPNKPNVFWDALRCLRFLEKSKLIDFLDEDFDLSKVTYQKNINVRLSKDYHGNTTYTLLYWNDYEKIIQNNKHLNTEALISVFLFVSSFMVIRDRFMPEEEYAKSPSAYFGSIKNIADTLHLSLTFVKECLAFLSDDSNFPDDEAILRKLRVGSIYLENIKAPRNIPCIYVRNRSGFKKEQELALYCIQNKYKKRNFNPQKGTGSSPKKVKAREVPAGHMSDEDIEEYISLYGDISFGDEYDEDLDNF